jgi:hypothetical protein
VMQSVKAYCSKWRRSSVIFGWHAKFLEPPAVNRSVTFRKLVDRKRGIVLPHKSRVGMAPLAVIVPLTGLVALVGKPSSASARQSFDHSSSTSLHYNGHLNGDAHSCRSYPTREATLHPNQAWALLKTTALHAGSSTVPSAWQDNSFAISSSEVTQTHLKPSFLRPSPILREEAISVIGTIVHFALYKNKLPGNHNQSSVNYYSFMIFGSFSPTRDF